MILDRDFFSTPDKQDMKNKVILAIYSMVNL